MMNERSLPYLLQVRDAVLCTAQGIVDLALAEGRALKPDELTRIESLREQVGELSVRISEQRKENRRQLSLPQRY